MKLGITAFKRLENQLEKFNWAGDPKHSHLKYWHCITKEMDNGKKQEDDRCSTIIRDRFTKFSNTSNKKEEGRSGLSTWKYQFSYDH